MTDREKLDTLIRAVYEFAGRPTKDGAKKLKSIAFSFDRDTGYGTEASVDISSSAALSEDMIYNTLKIVKKENK